MLERLSDLLLGGRARSLREQSSLEVRPILFFPVEFSSLSKLCWCACGGGWGWGGGGVDTYLFPFPDQ